MLVLPSNLPGHLLDIWKREPTVSANVVDWHVEAERGAQFLDFPQDMHPRIAHYLLSSSKISRLYSHQVAAWQAAQAGENVVVVTGTASGKTLCYNLPVLDRALLDPDARALFLFPTKALTQDQYQGLLAATRAISAGSEPIPVSVYDGDTPTNDRPAIRSKARLVLSNPDMLHTGILPHHTRWAEFFRGLR